MSKRRSIYLPGYLVDVLQKLKPNERLSVSDWAEKYRVLDTKTSAMPGRWTNSKTPYLIDIMNELNNVETSEIIFVKATQLGGTEVLLNMLGYMLLLDPSPTLIVYPNDKLAERISVNRLQPMLRLIPELKEKFNEYKSQKLELVFDENTVALSGSNSPANLASFAMKYLFVDEVDKFNGASKKEADGLSLAKERQKTFYNHKLFITSTPTIKENYIWQAKKQADIEKHYFVPCPHCHEYIELKFNQLEWDKDENKELTVTERTATTRYICQSCNAEIYDGDKQSMLIKGKWQVVKGGEGAKSSIAYWLNTLYSPFVRFSDIAKEWLNSYKDPSKKQNFMNSWLALPFENEIYKSQADDVLNKATDLEKNIVPEWAIALTAGVDVQENCVYWTIRAWGYDNTSQNIAHGQAMNLESLDNIIPKDFYKENGEILTVTLCLVDSGNDTEKVYTYCTPRNEYILPCKGASKKMDNAFKISRINRVGSINDGMTLIIVDTHQYKDIISYRLNLEKGVGCFMTYKNCDREYAEQLTAEHKVWVKNSTGKMRIAWQPKTHGRDNHYLDTEVYAYAAADIIGVRTWTKESEEAEEQKGATNYLETHSNWLNVRGKWL